MYKNKYENSKVYKLYDNTNGDCYYGSTVQSLAKRLAVHKSSAKKEGKGKCKSKSIILNGDYNISLVEEVNCQNKEQLIARERYYIENNDCVNKNIPGRTRQETQKAYDDSRKESRKEYHRNRYLAKKEQLLAELKTLDEMDLDSTDSNA